MLPPPPTSLFCLFSIFWLCLYALCLYEINSSYKRNTRDSTLVNDLSWSYVCAFIVELSLVVIECYSLSNFIFMIFFFQKWSSPSNYLPLLQLTWISRFFFSSLFFSFIIISIHRSVVDLRPRINSFSLSYFFSNTTRYSLASQTQL